METMMESCRADFSDQNTGLSLSKLRTEYEALSADELHEKQEDQYFSSLLKPVDTVITQLKTKDEL